MRIGVFGAGAIGCVVGGLMLAGFIGALGWAVGGWVTRLARFGIDANRADMLVQIREAVTRFSAGLR